MLYFVTTNKGKFEIIKSVLQQYGIELQQKPVELNELESDRLKEVALGKARQAFEKLRQPLIVEDTGFFLDAYKGFPGQHSKWLFQKIGYDGFSKLLSGKTRKAFFHTVICLIDGEEHYHFFEGKWSGMVSQKVAKKKSPSLPYARIFVPKGEKKTAVELPMEKRINQSQRGIAAHALGKWLKEKALHDLIESI